MLKKLGESKFSYVSMKDIKGPAKAGGTSFFETIFVCLDDG